MAHVRWRSPGLKVIEVTRKEAAELVRDLALALAGQDVAAELNVSGDDWPAGSKLLLQVGVPLVVDPPPVRGPG